MRSVLVPSSPAFPAFTPAERISQQRQRLRQLTLEYAEQAQRALGLHEMMKGSVYRLRTRCGVASCHCAQPGSSSRHEAMVLSWGTGKQRHLRCILPADVERMRRLTGNHRQLRRVRQNLGRLHGDVLAALQQLERLLLVPPPVSRRPSRSRTAALPANQQSLQP